MESLSYVLCKKPTTKQLMPICMWFQEESSPMQFAMATTPRSLKTPKSKGSSRWATIGPQSASKYFKWQEQEHFSNQSKSSDKISQVEFRKYKYHVWWDLSRKEVLKLDRVFQVNWFSKYTLCVSRNKTAQKKRCWNWIRSFKQSGFQSTCISRDGISQEKECMGFLRKRSVEGAYLSSKVVFKLQVFHRMRSQK